MTNLNFECLLGLQCNDFVMIAADQSSNHSFMFMDEDEEKIYKVSDHFVMSVIGELADKNQFAEYIAKYTHLYKKRNGHELVPSAVASFTRRKLIDYLTCTTPYFVNILMASYDKGSGPGLYFLSNLAASVKVPFAARGFGAHLSLVIMDVEHKKDCTEEEAYEIFKQCIREVQKVLRVSLPTFQVTVVNRDGIKVLPVIDSALLK